MIDLLVIAAAILAIVANLTAFSIGYYAAIQTFRSEFKNADIPPEERENRLPKNPRRNSDALSAAEAEKLEDDDDE